MKYVIDCSTAFKWYVSEIHTPKALNLRNKFIAGACELLAPDLFPIEIANSLLTAEQGTHPRIGAGDAARYLADVLKALPAIFDSIPLLLRAQEIAKQHKRSVYDCLNVALAEQEKCELVTSDSKLVAALQAAFPFVVHLASMP
jgi:predicted nucleic acid-binding protein